MMAEIDIVLFDPTQFYTSVNPYWIPVRAGILLASQMQGVKITYHTPSCNGEYNYSNLHTDMHNILKSILVKSPSGVVVSLSDFNSHKEILQAIHDKGIPVIYIIAPEDFEPKALANIGSDLTREGYIAMNELKCNEKDKVLILRNFKKGLSDMFAQRDKGIEAYLEEKGIDQNNVSELFVNVGPDSNPEQQIINTLKKNEISTILSYNVQVSNAYVNAIETLSQENKPIPSKACCFDLTQKVLNSIDKGNITCAIDEQPFLIGYLSVTLLGLYLANGIMPPNIKTGPFVINQKNIKETLLMFSQKR